MNTSQAVLSTLLVSALCLTSLPALAGANNAWLTCTSKHKKIALEGNIPGDFDEFSLKLTVNGQSRTFNQKKNRLVIIEKFKHKVFTLAVLDKDTPGIRLYALPRTVRIKHKGRDVKGTFHIMIQMAVIPGAKGNPWNEGGHIKDQKLRCRYDYSI